jgi:hypothetical protein
VKSPDNGSYIQIALGVMKKSRPKIRAASMFLVAIRANPHRIGN